MYLSIINWSPHDVLEPQVRGGWWGLKADLGLETPDFQVPRTYRYYHDGGAILQELGFRNINPKNVGSRINLLRPLTAPIGNF